MQLVSEKANNINSTWSDHTKIKKKNVSKKTFTAKLTDTEQANGNEYFYTR